MLIDHIVEGAAGRDQSMPGMFLSQSTPAPASHAPPSSARKNHATRSATTAVQSRRTADPIRTGTFIANQAKPSRKAKRCASIMGRAESADSNDPSSGGGADFSSFFLASLDCSPLGPPVAVFGSAPSFGSDGPSSFGGGACRLLAVSAPGGSSGWRGGTPAAGWNRRGWSVGDGWRPGSDGPCAGECRCCMPYDAGWYGGGPWFCCVGGMP
mmetsp:Transcript_15168/g.34677  ORF Transcript_15168/g.34677 Transcript_15168/m.34677 type:complete len:212 (+) Transcript_15168:748-1383(+)